MTGLYTGNVVITHVDTGAIIKTFEVTEVPVRCVRFIARRNWFVCGSDDFHLRIFNYNTGEKVTALEAHPDYIRCLAVHPTQSLVLTGSDDMTIKLWDWEKGWKCVQIFEGHTHYIMNLAFNPKDSNTFASACLDRTVKVWSLGSPTANFTLDAHDKGVNYVEYYHGGDKPYLVTTGDDRLIKIWDYLSKSCIQTLEGHTSNVSFAIFHPSLPILVSGSEDGTIKIWHSSTYRLENTLDYGLERAWCVAYAKKGNDVAFGFDEGSVVVKLGREEPSVSMDSAGKVVYARNAEVLMATLQSGAEEGIPDGQRLAVTSRELGNTEIFAQTLQHSPNGRFVTVCGDGEYIIYTSLAWRNKSFGAGVGFAWATDSNTYAVREAGPKVKVFRNFKERPGLLRIAYTTDGIYGGTLLGVKGMGFVVFYDWETGAIVRRIDVEARNVHWSGTGNLVAIAGEDSFYVLRFDRDAYQAYLDNGGEVDDEGVEEAFELEADISEVVQTGKWIGDCFVYTNGANRLNYLVGGQTHTITHFDSQMYLLGYLPSHNRIYLCDKDVNFYAFSLSLSVIEYQTAVLRGDLEAASEILPSVPAEQRNRIARFLETQDLKDLALEVSTDPDHKFDLAIQLDDLDTALELARSSPHLGSQSKWRTVGDRALASWKVSLAEECFKMANDFSALLLIYTSTGDRAGLQSLSESATAAGLTNIAFACALQLGNSTSCVDLLLATDRAPEAALFSRTFAPSQTPKAVHAWRKTLELAKKPKQAAALADPAEQPDEFIEGWEAALQREQDVLSGAANEASLIELVEQDEGRAVGHESYEEQTYEEAQQDATAPSFQLNGLSIHDQQQQQYAEAPLVDLGAQEPTAASAHHYENGNGNGHHVQDDDEEDLLGTRCAMLIIKAVPPPPRSAAALPRLRPPQYPSKSTSALLPPRRPFTAPFLPQEIIDLIISFIRDDQPYFIDEGEYDEAPDEEGDDLCLARCCLVAKTFLAPARKSLYTRICLFNADEIEGLTDLPPHLALLVETVVIESDKDWVEWGAGGHLRKILSPDGGYANITELDLKLEKAAGAAAIEILGSLHINDPPNTRLKTLRVNLPSVHNGLSRSQEFVLQITFRNALQSQPGLRSLTISADAGQAQVDWMAEVPHLQLEELDLDLRTRPIEAFESLTVIPRPSLQSLTIRLGSHVALDWAAITVAFPNLTTLRLTDCPPDPANFFMAISTLPLTHLFILDDLPAGCTFNPLPLLPATLTSANVPLTAILDLVPFLESRQCPQLECADFYAVNASPELGCTPWSELEVALAAQRNGLCLVQRSPGDDDAANWEVGEGEVEV